MVELVDLGGVVFLLYEETESCTPYSWLILLNQLKGSCAIISNVEIFVSKLGFMNYHNVKSY